MFRSKFLFDRKSRRENASETNSTKETVVKVKTIDGNNNNSNFSRNNSTYRVRSINHQQSRLGSNFDFIEPCDIVDDLNNEVDSLDSLEIKNWRYHLTNNRF
ncbi:hypothetical protein PVAND_001756 [Polypedilum vanderplanki]|uniref:Uncharacterized protein n=1 Tax=Polypedilum vanderplanki TaxID=319348 RepID=A0A9J6BQ64_POLVA|nr:hypothetical protein PVAND_001756 [Polypedilum vanderplanki]